MLDHCTPSTMIAAVLCALLCFSGGLGRRLAAADEKTAGDQKPPEAKAVYPTTTAPPAETGSSGGGGTPASSGGSSASAAAAASGGGGYDPAGEPEIGMNQKAIEDILLEHNGFRAKEHVPPLVWNETLARFSQAYAETLRAPCMPVHSTSPYGENLILGTGAVTWKNIVDQWSSEKRSYHYGSNSCDAGKLCGHYTAVVWKGTTSVGCGRVVCDNGDSMIMCSYWPPGNYDGVKPF